MKHRSRFFAAALVFAFAALFMAAGASSASDIDLFDPNVRLQDNFYPPDLSNQLIVADADAQCAPNTTLGQPSTIHVQRTTPFPGGPPNNVGGSASIPGGGWLYGSITWSLDVMIGGQTQASVADFWPLNDNGAPMGSSGFNTGAIQSVSGSFTIDPEAAGVPNIVGTVTGGPNAANWGVCRKFAGETTESPINGGDVTGKFYMINAGVLSYHVTEGPAGIDEESGPATAYFMNSLSTWDCPTCGGPFDGARAGHFRLEFGTTVLAGGVQQMAAGTGVAPVTVQPLPGVALTFDDVTTSGGTNVVQTTDAPPLPGGFELAGGFFYEIFTTASYTGSIKVCFPTGGGPPAPQILHFVSTPAPGWVDVPTTVEGTSPNLQACGNVSSLSPFAVGFEEMAAAPEEMIADLVDKTLLYLDKPALAPGLKAQLQAAAAALVAKRPKVACASMALYIAAVKVAPSSAFTSTEKDALTADAKAIRVAIAC